MDVTESIGDNNQTQIQTENESNDESPVRKPIEIFFTNNFFFFINLKKMFL